jgi:hypothetical protein
MNFRLPTLWEISDQHDRIRRRCLAQRAHEWQRLRGLPRLIRRVWIYCWAWRRADKELELEQDDHKLY